MSPRAVSPPRLLAVAVLAWTAVSWGGRIGLLTEAEAADAFTLVRVYGSIALALAVAAGLWWRTAWHRGIGWVFAAWTVALWARALVVAWTDPPSTGFAVVHTVLALGWFALSSLVVRDVRRPADT
jgi:hypothetical protein